MKKMLAICLALMLGAGVCMAQNNKPAKKQSKQLTTTVFATNLDCPNCAK